MTTPLACSVMHLDINTLLDRQKDESWHHLPCFSAIVHGYPELLACLLREGLEPDGVACTEYLEVSQIFCFSLSQNIISSSHKLEGIASNGDSAHLFVLNGFITFCVLKSLSLSQQGVEMYYSDAINIC